MDYGFWSNFRPNTIDYGLLYDFEANTMEAKTMKLRQWTLV